jgi:hypothetical protein
VVMAWAEWAACQGWTCKVHIRPSFDAAWRELNRKSATLWLLLFGCVPAMFLLAYLRNDLLFPEEAFLVIALAWLPAIAWAGCRMARFACPRCARAFFEDWHFFWPLKRSCAHCKLPRRAKAVSLAAVS